MDQMTDQNMIDRSMEDIRMGRTQPAKPAIKKIMDELSLEEVNKLICKQTKQISILIRCFWIVAIIHLITLMSGFLVL